MDKYTVAVRKELAHNKELATEISNVLASAFPGDPQTVFGGTAA